MVVNCKKCGGVDHSTFVHLDDSKDSTRMPNNSKSSTCNAVTNDIVGDECISMPTVNVVVNNAYVQPLMQSQFRQPLVQQPTSLPWGGIYPGYNGQFMPLMNLSNTL